MCFLFSRSLRLERLLCAMWHEFGRLRQQPPLPLSQPLVGEKKERSGEDGGGGLTQESGVFWNESSKELPAAYINHPQLAQRGNSICRELRCILFIEELLVIRPYTPSRSKSQATRQEASTCFFYKKAEQNPPHSIEEKNLLMRAQLVPVSSDGVLFVQQSRGICVNPSTTKSA